MPELSEAEAASLSKQHQDWVFSIPTQAHVKAVSPGEAQSLARSDATAMVGRTAPQLAKLKGDLCRVERTLPRAALQESWKSERWRQVSMLCAALQYTGDSAPCVSCPMLGCGYTTVVCRLKISVVPGSRLCAIDWYRFSLTAEHKAMIGWQSAERCAEILFTL